MFNLDPILGVIYDFNNDELYSGSIEEKARMNKSIISVSSFKDKKDSTLVTGISAKMSYRDEEFKIMISDFQSWKKIRSDWFCGYGICLCCFR